MSKVKLPTAENIEIVKRGTSGKTIFVHADSVGFPLNFATDVLSYEEMKRKLADFGDKGEVRTYCYEFFDSRLTEEYTVIFINKHVIDICLNDLLLNIDPRFKRTYRYGNNFPKLAAAGEFDTDVYWDWHMNETYTPAKKDVPELINKDQLLGYLKFDRDRTAISGNNMFDSGVRSGMNNAISCVANMRPVVTKTRQHGHWIEINPPDKNNNFIKCSVCGSRFGLYSKGNYCQECGAIMIGGDGW